MCDTTMAIIHKLIQDKTITLVNPDHSVADVFRYIYGPHCNSSSEPISKCEIIDIDMASCNWNSVEEFQLFLQNGIATNAPKLPYTISNLWMSNEAKLYVDLQIMETIEQHAERQKHLQYQKAYREQKHLVETHYNRRHDREKRYLQYLNLKKEFENDFF